MTDQVTAALHV